MPLGPTVRLMGRPPNRLFRLVLESQRARHDKTRMFYARKKLSALLAAQGVTRAAV